MSTPNVFDMTLDTSKLSRSALRGLRIVSAVTGIVALALGIMVLVWPSATLGVVAFLFGLYFLISGLFRTVVGIVARGLSAGNRILNIVLGVLLFIVGVFLLKNPLDSLIVLGILVGLAWILEGILTLTESDRGSARWVGITFGVVSLIAGLIVLFVPVASIAVLVIVGGWFLIILGILQVIRAFALGSARKTVS